MFASQIQDIYEVLLGSLIWLLSSPVILLALIYKALVTLWIRIRYESGELSDLNLTDKQYITKEFSNMFGYAFVTEGSLDLNQVRDHFKETFISQNYKINVKANFKNLKYPIFFEYIESVLGFDYKRRASELDLKRHVREITMNSSLKMEQELRNIMDQNGHLKGKIPKWEIIILHIPWEERSVVVFKISHALADASSVLVLMGKFTGNFIPEPRKYAQDETVWHKAKVLLRAPLKIMQMNQKGSIPNPEVHTFGLKKSDVFRTFMSTTTLDFSKIKNISKQSQTRVLAILISLQLGAMKRSLETLGKVENDAQVCEKCVIRYSLAIKRHPAYYGNRFCNHWGLGQAAFPLKLDRLKRLQEIHKMCEENESGGYSEAYFRIGSLLGPLIPRWVGVKMLDVFLAKPFYTWINPFVYPNNKYKITGVLVSNIFFLHSLDTPYDTPGTLMAPITRGNELDISVHVTGEVFSTQEEIDFHVKIMLKDELDRLLEEGQMNRIKDYVVDIDKNGIDNGAFCMSHL